MFVTEPSVKLTTQKAASSAPVLSKYHDAQERRRGCNVEARGTNRGHFDELQRQPEPSR
jgi:hypothetical protein